MKIEIDYTVERKKIAPVGKCMERWKCHKKNTSSQYETVNEHERIMITRWQLAFP